MNPLYGFDCAVNFTYLSDVAFGCQTATVSTWAAWPEWLSNPGLSLFSDTAVCLFWRARIKKKKCFFIYIKSLCTQTSLAEECLFVTRLCVFATLTVNALQLQSMYFHW